MQLVMCRRKCTPQEIRKIANETKRKNKRKDKKIKDNKNKN